MYPQETDSDPQGHINLQKQMKNKERENKKLKLQQYFAQQCQQEYQELYPLKEGPQNSTRSVSPRKDTFYKSRQQLSPVQQKTPKLLVSIQSNISPKDCLQSKTETENN